MAARRKKRRSKKRRKKSGAKKRRGQHIPLPILQKRLKKLSKIVASRS
jgi:hypothetical protein